METVEYRAAQSYIFRKMNMHTHIYIYVCIYVYVYMYMSSSDVHVFKYIPALGQPRKCSKETQSCNLGRGQRADL